MKPEEYLQKILESQKLPEDSDDLKLLRKRRDEIETRLRTKFGSSPTIRYGGSQAKGTLIKDSYDLDIVCYFNRADDSGGTSLEEIYNSVKDELSKHYSVDPKTSALRVRGANNVDFHVDVVPGRFIDDEESYDVFLYCASGEKCRLKTNIETHIGHVRDSGVTDEIKLMKLWKARHWVPLKTFVLELAVIDVLEGTGGTLDERVREFLEKLRDEPEEINVEDSANPSGNDLSDHWNDQVRSTVSAMARSTLIAIDTAGWEAVFGKLPENSTSATLDGLRSAAKAAPAATRPWRRG